ncbi:RNA-binding protein [Anaeramoeba flamelloides]|uniref:RNA-binding protein n=1 Tax=Anaeramoeba flamelloides TaxID=1746091 RepID=A0ABQ8XHU7_9EUKA|nr:RNA-binding protein [Anaeramoeba flamelloides]
MNRNTNSKLFISNLPKEYSVDLLIKKITKWIGSYPGLQILQNKKNPNNGLAILSSITQEQSIVLIQMFKKTKFQNRQLRVSNYVPRKKKNFQINKKENYSSNKAKTKNEQEKTKKNKKKIHSPYNSKFNYDSRPNKTANDDYKQNDFFDHDHKRSNFCLHKQTYSEAKNTTTTENFQIFISNIHYSASETSLTQEIEKVISIKKLIYLNNAEGKFMGKAIIILYNYQDLVKLMNYPHKIYLNKRPINVRIYNNNKHKTNNHLNPNKNQRNLNKTQQNINSTLFNEIKGLKNIIQNLSLTIVNLQENLNKNNKLLQNSNEKIIFLKEYTQNLVNHKLQNDNIILQNSSFNSQVNFENPKDNSQILVENNDLNLENNIINSSNDPVSFKPCAKKQKENNSDIKQNKNEQKNKKTKKIHSPYNSKFNYDSRPNKTANDDYKQNDFFDHDHKDQIFCLHKQTYSEAKTPPQQKNFQIFISNIHYSASETSLTQEIEKVISIKN